MVPLSTANGGTPEARGRKRINPATSAKRSAESCDPARITDSALAELREIVEFFAQNDSHAAERMGNRLVARALDLATMPERQALHDAARCIRRFPVLPFLVFYHCDHASKTVSIPHFWHGARRWPEFG